MPYYLGAFLVVALEWCAQAKSKADEARTLQTLRQEVATLKEEKEILCRGWACQEEVYKASLTSAREVNAEACKRLTELLAQVSSLQSKIVALEAAMQTSEAQQKRLADQCAVREQSLEKTEGELAEKMEKLNLLQTEHGQFQTELNRLQMEKEVLKKQLEKAKKSSLWRRKFGTPQSRRWSRPRRDLLTTWPILLQRVSRRL
ncbi:uncharacterized protein [Phaseolus vulgaris]|uniref:uncharacterized protein n=1 Tax=Phaseolus vulgaris TaxID=3885 RepID=UPI0035CBB306